MQIRSLVRAAMAAAILGLVAPTAARAQQFWDFAQMAGVGGDLGASRTFSFGAGYGSVVVRASNGFDLYGRNYGQPATNPDKGLGLCDIGNADHPDCAHGSNSGSSFEIGDLPTNAGGFITIDFSGLLVPLNSIKLASLSQGSDYAHVYTYTTAGSANCSTASYTDQGNKTDNNSDQFFLLSGAPYNTADCVKLGSDSHQGAGWQWINYCFTYDQTVDKGDYLLQGIWTDVPGIGTGQNVTPEPASMTLIATGLVGMMAAARRRRSKK